MIFLKKCFLILIKIRMFNIYFKNCNFDFLKFRKLFFFISVFCIFLSIFSLFKNGIFWGLEFKGGIQAEINLKYHVNVDIILKKLNTNDFHGFKFKILENSNNFLIQFLDFSEFNEIFFLNKIYDLFNDTNVNHNIVYIKKIDHLGAEISKHFISRSITAIFFSIFAMIFYISFRFKYKFAFGAIIALLHDIIITMGIFSFFGIEFNLSVLSSLLAVWGYSVNDTIVIFDRIRENFKKFYGDNIITIINISINQTLFRTLVTSFSTLLVILIILFYCGDVLYGFSLFLFIGVIVGTYSSIYIACCTSIMIGLSKDDINFDVKKNILYLH